MKYKRLFERGKIGKLEIKNRVVVTPVGLTYAQSSGEVGPRLFGYLEERARGGAGIIISGIVLVDSKTGKINPNELVLENRAQAMSFAGLARMIHKYDAKLFLQLYHPGKSTVSKNLNDEPAWSASPNMTANGELTKEMTKEDIKYMIDCYVNSALLAKNAGVDGVEIHAAHGYLLGQFLTPLHNRRTDEYGGCLENRMRIVVEVYNAIRQAAGRDFVVGIRMSADEYIEGGNTLTDGIKMAEKYDSLGVDYINVSCGLQESSHFNREPPSFSQGWKRINAKSIRETVNCPIIAVNTIKKPDFAELLLEEGVCDYVGLSRGHLADPHWVKKTKEGREDEIRICISCLNCMATFIQGIPPTCTVNPALGRELEFEGLKRDGEGRPVVVVGGGPGGMEAARVLAERGFHVTLFEKSEMLGGQLNLAEKPPMKEKIEWLKKNLETQVYRAGTKVLLNTEATVKRIKALSPIGIFCAAGSAPVRPSAIPGINGSNVFTVPEVLMEKERLDNKKIVIVGTGLAGLETGAFLARRGCQLTFIEMAKTAGEGIFGQVREDVLDEIGQAGETQMYTGTILTGITPFGVCCRKENDEAIVIHGDAVVLAMGAAPKKELTEGLRGCFENVISIGDADSAGRILEAISDGYSKAWVFDPISR